MKRKMQRLTRRAGRTKRPAPRRPRTRPAARTVTPTQQRARKKKSRSAVRRNTSGLRRGGPGRTKGVPNRVTREAKAFCAALVGDPAYVERFHRAFVTRRLAQRLEAMVWHYAFGKPRQAFDVTMKPHTLEEIIAGASDEPPIEMGAVDVGQALPPVRDTNHGDRGAVRPGPVGEGTGALDVLAGEETPARRGRRPDLPYTTPRETR